MNKRSPLDRWVFFLDVFGGRWVHRAEGSMWGTAADPAASGRGDGTRETRFRLQLANPRLAIIFYANARDVLLEGAEGVTERIAFHLTKSWLLLMLDDAHLRRSRQSFEPIHAISLGPAIAL
jgi:hypothetical protein